MCAFSFLKRFFAAALLAVGIYSLAPAARAQIIIPGGGPTVTYTATNYLHFLSTNYFVAENGLQALITVVRDGPNTNDFVTVDYTMTDGTAISGIHYYRQSGTLSFFAGQNRLQFAVPIIDNYNAGGDVYLNLSLRNPGSGATTLALLGTPAAATLTIKDDESIASTTPAGSVEIAPGNGGSVWKFSTGTGDYLANIEEWNTDVAPSAEANFTPYGPAGPEITIVRKGGSKGRILVDWRTTTNVVPEFSSFFFFDPNTGFPFGGGGGLAVPGEDFLQTNGTVTLDDYQMAVRVLLPLPATKNPEFWSIFNRNFTNFFFDFPKTFGVELTAVRAAPEEAGIGLTPTLGAIVQRNVLIGSAANGFAFTRQRYVVREGQRFVRVRVRRSINPSDANNPLAAVHVHYTVNPRTIVADAKGGDHQGNNFPLMPGSEYSTPFVDYEPPGSDMWAATVATNNLGPNAAHWVDLDAEATINWGDGEVTDKFILIPLIDDNEAEFNEDLEVVLWKHGAETDGFVSSYAGDCTITVVDNDQPAGASDVKFNPDSDPLTDPPYMTSPGANNTVQAVVTQPDGKIVLGGDFTAVNTLPRNKIARLNFDGSSDRTFNPGTGVSGFVRALALQPDGSIIVAGGFDAYNGISRVNIARILTSGALDTTFNPGIGTDGPIRAIAIQPDGQILIGGDFNTYNGTNVNYLARLNPDGSLDTTFNTGSGPDGPVNSIAVTGGPIDVDRTESGGPAEDRFLVDTGSSRGTLTINYDFFNIPDSLRVYYGGVDGGVAIYDTGLVSSNGTITINYPPVGVPATSTLLEIVMNQGSGIDGTIWFYSLHIDPAEDPRPVIGGEFANINGVPINNIARLNTDGSLDRTFDPGSGADDRVYAVAKQGNKVIMAGDFRTVNLQERRGVARLNEDGSLDQGFDPGSGFDNSVFTIAIQPTGKPVLGGPFRSFNQTRRVGLARLNLDGSLDTSFMDTAKNQFAGVPTRLSPENPESQENFIRSLANYRITNFIISTNFVVDTNNVTNAVFTTNITTADHLFIAGHFTNPGGGFNRDQARPRLNIARVIGGATPGPGNIAFLRDSYSVDENAGTTYITLIRTNGSLAPISARFDAKDFPNLGPGIATGGADYQVTNYFPIWVRSHDTDRQYSDAFMGPNFNAFSTNRQRTDLNVYPFPTRPPLRYSNYAEDDIFVSIFDDNIVEGDEVVNLTLTAPDEGRLLLGGQPIPVGTALGKAHASLTIVDNDFDFGTLGFSAPEYFVNENELRATIYVTRTGGTSGSVTVDVYTLDGTAGPSDYVGIPKNAPTTLYFDPGQRTNKFTIAIKNDTIAELEETVKLFLTNATGFPANIPIAQRLDPARSTAVLNIIDDDYAPGRLSFTSSTYSVLEGAGSVTVTVRRNGGNVGDVTVNFQTQDGSARAGIDYVSTNGFLNWPDGDSSAKSFTIPVIDNSIVEPDKTFNVVISNPQPFPAMQYSLGATPKAVVTIKNDDAPGSFSFSQPIYNADENGPYADITVLRQGGISGAVAVHYAATDGTAIGTTNVSLTFSQSGVPNYVFPQYVAANGFTNVLRFAPGQTAASFRVPLIDNPIFDGQKVVNLGLFDASGGASLGTTNAVLVIIDDEQNRIPAGSLDTEFTAKGADDYVYSIALQNDGKILVGGDFKAVNAVSRNRLARLDPAGVLDPSFVATAGPNDSVRSIQIQSSDNRIFIGGLFSSLGATNRNHVARLNSDGQADTTFDPGSGTDNPIFSLAEQSDGKVIIVGNFTTYRLIARKGIARVLADGTLDTSFDPGTSANGAIWAVAVQQDGKILIGGDFTTYNEIPRNRIARLNSDGTLDRTFGEGLAGAGGSVRTIVIQTDANILVGGLFTNFNGRPFNRIVRVQATGASMGAIDDTFTLGASNDAGRALAGANGAVNSIAVQLDGKILIGGDFTQFNGRTRNRLTRLDSDGSLDPSINFGAGANGPVSAIVVQPDRKILIGGGFTEYDGTPVLHLARIQGGAMSGSGQLQFTSPFFAASETDANAIVNVRRSGGTRGTLSVDFITLTNDTAVAGQDFRPVTNSLVFPEAETFQSVLVPLLRNTNALEDRYIQVVLANLVGDGTLGAQPRARITVVNADSIVQFSRPDYSVAENFAAGAATITVRRVGSTLAPLSVDFLTQDDTATAGADYGAVSSTLTFAPGEASRTVAIPIFDDTLVEGDERVTLILTNLVGFGIIGTPTATLTIVDNDFAPGQIEFTSTTYTGLEGSKQVVIRLHRVGGTTGVISVEYQTQQGGDNPASTPSDYIESHGIVSFSDGVVDQSFIIPVVDDTLVEGNETFLVNILNAKGGASILGPTQATAIIIDDDLPSGSLDRSFDPGSGANGEIRTLKLDGSGHILIGGAFTVFNGANRSHIARLNTDAGVDAGFDPGVGPDSTVADIEVDPDGRLTIGGQFNTVRGLFLNRVARLNADGSTDTSFALPLGLNAEVSDVLRQPDGKVLIGGTFNVVDAAILNHIARLNADGTVDVSFNPGGGADANVNAIALQPDGKVLVGGAFSRIDGVTRSGILRLNTNGSVDTGFNAAGSGTAGGAVQDILVLTNGQILIAGDFTSYNGSGRARVARLLPDGSLDAQFDPGAGPNKVVYAIAQQGDGKVIIAGDFTSVASTNRNRLARLNTDGSHDTDFKPGSGANDSVLAVAVQPDDGRILIAGRFTQVDNESRPRIARLNNDKQFITLKDVVFSPVVRSGDKLELTAATQVGFTYTLESNSTLSGSWKTEQSVVAQGSTTTFEITPSLSHQFFRIRRE